MVTRMPKTEEPASERQDSEMSDSTQKRQKGKLLQMPLRTDNSSQTSGKNVAGTPSTVGGKLHPSVADGVENATPMASDSMFNSADPQGNSTWKKSGSKKKHKRA